MSMRRIFLAGTLAITALLTPGAALAATSGRFDVSVDGQARIVYSETDPDAVEPGCVKGETESTARFRTIRPARVLVAYDAKHRRLTMLDQVPRRARTTATITQSATGLHDFASACRGQPATPDCGSKPSSP